MASILLVEKHTDYEMSQAQGTWDRVPRERKDAMLAKHELHRRTMNGIEEILNDFEVHSIHAKGLEGLSPDLYSAAISIGGDGTFLAVADATRTGMVLGVITGGLGKLCSVGADQIELLGGLSNEAFVVENWQRLMANVNGKDLPALATNEIRVEAPPGPAAHIEITYNGINEECTCSGIVAATPQGSTGLFSSATGGHEIERGIPAYGVAIINTHRDSWQCAFRSRTIPEDRFVRVMPLRDGHTLIYDGIAKNTVPLRAYDTVEVRVSTTPLRVIRFYPSRAQEFPSAYEGLPQGSVSHLQG
jgi:NAD kinase